MQAPGLNRQQGAAPIGRGKMQGEIGTAGRQPKVGVRKSEMPGLKRREHQAESNDVHELEREIVRQIHDEQGTSNRSRSGTGRDVKKKLK